MKINTSPKKIDEILTRGVEGIIKKESLIKKLKSGRRLRVKHGIDPTTKDLHIGYAVVYEKLRLLQEMGHQIVFLIGDFTGRFGDPTQRLEIRKLRNKKEVLALSKKYFKQIGKLLDLNKTEIRYNSEWYDKMSAEELLKIMSSFTTMRMLERDMFQERIKKGQDIRLHEPVYPVLQGYDSVMLKSDLTVNGADQIFNELQGRKLQEEFNQPPQDILMVKLLIGTDGRQKMSQSLGNYIGIIEKAGDQYGKIMSIPDNIICHYFELATGIPIKEIEKIKEGLETDKVKPQEAKSKLAREIVSVYHGKKRALIVEEEFNRVFREKKLPAKIPEIQIKERYLNILEFLMKIKLIPSKSEAKRLILQKGIKISGKVQENWQETIQIKKGMVVQAGKRKFVKIV